MHAILLMLNMRVSPPWPTIRLGKGGETYSNPSTHDHIVSWIDFHDFLCLWPIRHVTNWTTHSKHIMRSAHATNTLPIIKSITTLVRSNPRSNPRDCALPPHWIVLLDSMCSNQRPEKNQHCLLLSYEGL
jgi:hypothetical protein